VAKPAEAALERVRPLDKFQSLFDAAKTPPKPKIRLNTQQIEEGLAPKPAAAPPTKGRPKRVQPVIEPKEPFDTYLKDSIGTASPEVIAQLKTVFETKGKEAALDMAIDLAAQGKLTVR
jgi:hypothetical protein